MTLKIRKKKNQQDLKIVLWAFGVARIASESFHFKNMFTGAPQRRKLLVRLLLPSALRRSLERSSPGKSGWAFSHSPGFYGRLWPIQVKSKLTGMMVFLLLISLRGPETKLSHFSRYSSGRSAMKSCLWQNKSRRRRKKMRQKPHLEYIFLRRCYYIHFRNWISHDWLF